MTRIRIEDLEGQGGFSAVWGGAGVAYYYNDPASDVRGGLSNLYQGAISYFDDPYGGQKGLSRMFKGTTSYFSDPY